MKQFNGVETLTIIKSKSAQIWNTKKSHSYETSCLLDI